MELLDAFKQYIREQQLFHQTDRLLLAVSGGVDSVVMAELCRQAGYAFAIAHCDFGLRGADSDADALWVQSLATKYEVPFHCIRFETEAFARERSMGIQEAARRLRYDWFELLLKEHGYQYLLTAHHADDNVETMLMNFFKGTGINGIKGIYPKKRRVLRPLLFARKEQLVSFAGEQQLGFREDASNSSNKYSRNYVRNKLLPVLEELYPGVTSNLQHNAERFRDIQLLYDKAVAREIKGLLFEDGPHYKMPVLKLQKTLGLSTILYEIIKRFGFTPHQHAEVSRLLKSDTGRYVCSSSHRILRNRQWLLITPLNDVMAGVIPIEQGQDRIEFELGQLTIKVREASPAISKDPLVAALDASGISYPLLLRKWKTGDYFYPLGMQKKKKLSRFLIDQKCSLAEKEKTWVIESNKRIIWVIGKRIDDRFKTTPATKQQLVFQLRPSQ